MKTLTEQLLEASQGVLNLQPEVSDSTGKYHMFDDGGVESEVGEFLYGIVKVLKPEKILETGTYSGISSMYMAQGLKDNGFGHLTTVEYEITHKNRAEKLWGNCGLSEFVTCKLQSSLDFNPDNYELIFLDTEPNLRFKELVKFFPNLKDGGYFIIHDLHRHLSQEEHVDENGKHDFGWPFGILPDQMVEWIRTGKLRVFSFPTPRGISCFYKPREDDFS